MTITGKVKIGRGVHVGSGAGIFGANGFEIGDYSGISPGVQIFTATEDISGEWIMHPTCPDPDLRRTNGARITVGKHCTIGANSVLLPGAVLPDGAVVGSLSLVKERLSPWAVFAGVPAQFKRARSDRAAQLEKEIVWPSP